MRNIRPLNQ